MVAVWKILLKIIIISCLYDSASGLYTSTYKIESLTKLDFDFFKALLRYTEHQRNCSIEVIPAIQSFLKKEFAVPPNRDSVAHPVTTFHVLKRFTGDWRNIASLVFNNSDSQEKRCSKEFREFYRKKELEISKWPTMDDLHGAMTGLLHVWSVYHLDADDVIAGVIFGAPSTPLSTDDMLLLAEHARTLEFYTKEIALRQEYMKRLQLEEKEHLKHTLKLAKAYHNNKMSNTAMKLLSPLLLTAHGKVKPLLIKYGQAAKNQITPTGEVNEERQIASESDPLCRGITKTPKERSELHCTLRTKIPYYLVKEEVLHVHPRVSLFHEVLSEDDIKTLKRYTAQQVSKPSPAETEFVDLAMTIYQLNEKKFRRLSDKLSRRMSLITGLSTHLKTSQSDVEDFQVVNYGAGGQFPLHSDCRSEALWTSTDDNQLPLSPYVRYSGDNIATWIYFMSDVGEGGATIMPNLKVRVTPVKIGSRAIRSLQKHQKRDQMLWMSEHPLSTEHTHPVLFVMTCSCVVVSMGCSLLEGT